MASSRERINRGAFIPTTSIWDTTEIRTVDVNSEQFKDLLVRLYQNINNIAIAVNLREAGYYDQTEFINGQLFFPNTALSSTTAQKPTYRQVFRKVINFGALPNTATKSVAHGLTIDSNVTFTRIYGAASDTSGFYYIPLPYAGTSDIELAVDSTNIDVTTTSDRTNFDTTYIILEYLKQ